MGFESEKKIYAKLFPPKNKRGRDTKLRLVECALKVMHEGGLEALTFEAVGKKASTTPAQVKYHFREKKELLETAIEYVLITYQETALQRLQSAESWRDKVYSLIEGTFDWLYQFPTQGATYLAFLHLAAVDKKYRSLHHQMLESGRNRVGALLKLSPQHSKMRGEDARALAISIWACIDGMAMYFLTTGLGSQEAFCRRSCRQSVEALLAEKSPKKKMRKTKK